MKRINEYKKLFNVEQDTDLKTLKTTYRNLVKEWHPDKFTENDELAIGLMMPLSLSVDHRIADGGETARFINSVMGYLNDPVSLLM